MIIIWVHYSFKPLGFAGFKTSVTREGFLLKKQTKIVPAVVAKKVSISFLLFIPVMYKTNYVIKFDKKNYRSISKSEAKEILASTPQRDDINYVSEMVLMYMDKLNEYAIKYNLNFNHYVHDVFKYEEIKNRFRENYILALENDIFDYVFELLLKSEGNNTKIYKSPKNPEDYILDASDKRKARKAVL